MKKILIVLILANIVFTLNAQSWIVEKIRKSTSQFYSSPIEFDDGNFFVRYSTFDFNVDNTGIDSLHMFFELRNCKGQLIKSKEILKTDTLVSLKKARKFNNDILLLLFGQITNSNRFTAIIQLMDEGQNVIFEKTINLEDRFLRRNDICIESDTTALILFNAESTTIGIDSTYFLRISNSGHISKYNTYFKRFGDDLKNIVNNFSNDSIRVLGTHYEYFLNDKFTPIFVKTLPFYSGDSWGSITKFSKSDYLWLTAYLTDTGYADIGLIKFDKNFSVSKIVQIGDPRYDELAASGNFYNFKSKNSIYSVGTLASPPLVLVNIPLIITRLDNNLNIIWTKYFSNNYLNGNPTIYATSDDGILLAGWKRDITDPDISPIAYLMKIDSSGNFPTATKNEKNDLQWSTTVYPNPSPGYFTISIDETLKDLNLKLYDEYGCIVFHSKSLQTGKHSFDLNHLPQGIYFYSIHFDGKERAKGKWVKN